MSTQKVTLGVIAGLAAGSILGILLAPDKGSNTIKKASRIGDDYANNLKDKFGNFRRNISRKLKTATEEQGSKEIPKDKDLESYHARLVDENESI